MMLLKCVAAYEAARKLRETELDFSAAYALMMLLRELEPRAQTYIEGEKRLVEKYGKKGEDGKIIISGSGSFDFESPEAAQSFYRERAELAAFEVSDLKFEPYKAKAPERITPAILEALDGFIIFEKEE